MSSQRLAEAGLIYIVYASIFDWHNLTGFVGLSDIGVVSVFVITIYDIISTKKIKRVFLAEFMLGVLFIWVYFFTPNRVVMSDHLRVGRIYVKVVMTLISSMYWIRSSNQVRRVLKSFIPMSFVVVVTSFLQGKFGLELPLFFKGPQGYSRLSSFGIDLGIERASGLVRGFGPYGTYVALGAMPALAYPYYKDKVRKTRVILSLLGVCMIVTGILTNQSRSTLLALLVGSLFIGASSGKKTRYSIIGITLVIILSYGEVIWSSLVQVNVASVYKRMDLNLEALYIAIENPFGIGGGRLETAIGLGSVVHNQFFTVLAASGVTGFIILVYYYVSSFKLVLKSMSNSGRRKFEIVSLSGIFLAGTCEQMFYGGLPNIAMWVVVGMCISFVRNIEGYSI